MTQLALNTTPARAIVPASAVRVGDFTHVTGYRRVVRVDNRPRKREVRLWWSDRRNDHKTYGYDTPLKVSRPA